MADMSVARTIYDVGRQMGVPHPVLLSAFQAALAESEMTNTRERNAWNDDSLGVFQQRPSQNWGSPQQIMDPRYAARRYLSAAQAVYNQGWTKSTGLLAAAVQRPKKKYVGRYDERLAEAKALLGQFQGYADPDGPAAPRVTRKGLPLEDELSLVGVDDRYTEDMSRKIMAAQIRAMSETVRAGAQGAPWDPIRTVMDTDGEDGLDERLGPTTDLGIDDNMLPPEQRVVPASKEVSLWEQRIAQVLQRRAQGQQTAEAESVDLQGVPASSDGSVPNAIVDLAAQYKGIPYKWGGTDPRTGLDCSGFIQHVFKRLGLNLPRVSRDQAKVGRAIGSLEEAMPGDLVAFASRGLAVGHIGIYIGNGQMIHAPRTGDVVKVSKVWANPIIRRVAGG